MSDPYQYVVVTLQTKAVAVCKTDAFSSFPIAVRSTSVGPFATMREAEAYAMWDGNGFGMVHVINPPKQKWSRVWQSLQGDMENDTDA